MSNIFQEFVQARPIKTPLKFGHNENIVIESIDFGVRKKNGIKINANTFIKLSQVDPESRKVEATTEISFWDLDHTRDFVVNNLSTEFTVMAGIIAAVGGDVDAFEEAVEEALGDDYENEIRTAKGAKRIQSALIDTFKTTLGDKVGLDMPLLKCKLVSNKNGFLQPAPEVNWIVAMDDEEGLPVMTAQEIRVHAEALKKDDTKKVAPDKTGEKPSGEAAVATDTLGMI